MTKANIFVLIKTSSEDERERRLQDVFIKTNVWWAESEFFLFCYFFISLLIFFLVWAVCPPNGGFMLKRNIHLVVLVKSLYR